MEAKPVGRPRDRDRDRNRERDRARACRYADPRARLRRAAAARGSRCRPSSSPWPSWPSYLAAKLAYRLRDVLLLMMVAGFIALILNPFVVFVQRRIPRRGPAVAIVTIWAILYFVPSSRPLLSIPAAAALQVVVREIWRPPRRAPSPRRRP